MNYRQMWVACTMTWEPYFFKPQPEPIFIYAHNAPKGSNYYFDDGRVGWILRATNMGKVYALGRIKPINLGWQLDVVVYD